MDEYLKSSGVECVLVDEYIGDKVNDHDFLLFDFVVIQLSTTDFQRYEAIKSKIDEKKTLLIGQAPSYLPELFSSLKVFKFDSELEVFRHMLVHAAGAIKAQSEPELLPKISLSKALLERYEVYFPMMSAYKVIWGQMLTSRGCLHKCSFCTNEIRESYGNRMIFLKTEKVIEQFNEHVRNGANAIYISDDDFTASKNHVEKFCDALILKNNKIPWTSHARVDEVDERILLKMKQSGCSLLRFGVEAADVETLKILKKTDNPELWVTQSIKAFEFCRKINLPTVGLFIIANPKETYSRVFNTIKLVLKLKPTLIQVHYFTAYPETSYATENNLNEVEAYHYKPTNNNHSNFNRFELVFLKFFFYLVFMCRFDFFWQNIKYFRWYYLYNLKNTLELLNSLPFFKLFQYLKK